MLNCIECGKTKDPRGLRCKRCHINHIRPDMKGENNPSYKGGRVIGHGYVYLYCPDHPYKDINNKVAEHRLIMEKHLGRYLEPKEVVHHKNGIKDDNRLENLELFDSAGWHSYKEHVNRDVITGRFFKREICQ